MLWALASFATDTKDVVPAPPGPLVRDVAWDAFWKRAQLKSTNYYSYWKAQPNDVANIELVLEQYVVDKTTSKTILTFSQDPLENAVRSTELIEIAIASADPEHKKPGERLSTWVKNQREDRGRGISIKNNPLPPFTSQPIEVVASRYYDVLFSVPFLKGLVFYEPSGGWMAMSEATTFGYLTSFMRDYWPWLLMGAAGITVGGYYLTRGKHHARY